MTLIRCYHSGPEWTWEQWQWRGTPHSPKLQHCWNLTIRLFSVISRRLVRGGGLPLCRGAVSVFYSPSWLGNLETDFCFSATYIEKADPYNIDYVFYFFTDWNLIFLKEIKLILLSSSISSNYSFVWVIFYKRKNVNIFSFTIMYLTQDIESFFLL